jgi:hypothetical protein
VRGGHTDDIGLFTEQFAAVLAEAGMPRLPARVFAALLVSETGRMTAGQLAETLQVSAGGISGAVRYLVPLHMIRTERDPGTRRNVYVADGSWYESLVSANPFLANGEGTLRDGVALLGDSPAGERIAETLELVQFLKEESRAMLRRWHERREVWQRSHSR